MRYLALPILLILLISCKRETTQDYTDEKSERDYSARIDTILQKYSTPLGKKESTDTLLARFIKLNRTTKELLLSYAPERANSLYESYYSENENILGQINENELESGFLYRYFEYNYQVDESKGTVMPDSIKQKKMSIEMGGLELWDEGEAIFIIRTPAHFYEDIFKDRVTDDYKEYIALDAIDHEELWINDAAIVIPWKELGNKVLAWENFLKKYPKSPLKGKARQGYTTYQFWYLFGVDNTPTYDTENMNIDLEIKSEFKRFIKAHPNSPTSKLAQKVLDNDGKDFEHLIEQIAKEQEVL